MERTYFHISKNINYKFFLFYQKRVTVNMHIVIDGMKKCFFKEGLPIYLLCNKSLRQYIFIFFINVYYADMRKSKYAKYGSPLKNLTLPYDNNNTCTRILANIWPSADRTNIQVCVFKLHLKHLSLQLKSW